MKNRTIFGLLLFALGFIGLFTACNKELFTENVVPKLDELQQVVEERASTFFKDILNSTNYSSILKKNGDIITYTGVLDNVTHNVSWWTKNRVANEFGLRMTDSKGKPFYFSINGAQGDLRMTANGKTGVIKSSSNEQAHHIIPFSMVRNPNSSVQHQDAPTAARLVTIAGMNGFHVNSIYNGIALIVDVPANTFNGSKCTARKFHANAPKYDAMVVQILERWIRTLIQGAPGGQTKSPYKDYATNVAQAQALAPLVNQFLQNNLIPFLNSALLEAQRKTIKGEMDAIKKVSYCNNNTSTLNNHYKSWNIDNPNTVDTELQQLAKKYSVNLFYKAPTITPGGTGG